MRMGTSLSARSRLQTSMPSSLGRPRSSTTRSGLNCSAAVSASAPSPALRTSWPSARSERRSTSAIASSSSTTSTRADAVACSITHPRVDAKAGRPSGLEGTFRGVAGPEPRLAWPCLATQGTAVTRRNGGWMLADRIFGAPERKDPPRRKRQRARAAKRRGGARPRAGSRGRGRSRTSPEVMQRRLDLAGLCCIGLAVYLGYVIYLGWNGGAVGNGSQTALDYAVGAGGGVVPVALGLARVGLIPPPLRPSPHSGAGPAAAAAPRVAPVALGLAGIGLILRPFLPSPKSVAVGVAAIAAGLLLALAAQTAGLGPEGVRKGLFDPNFFPHHGGGVGEVLYWATTTLFQRLGAQIIAVLLLVSGLLLLTGRSVSDMVRAARRGAERAKRGTVGFATAIRESRVHTDPDLIDTTPADTEPVFGPPEPVADGDDFQVLVGGDEQETEKVANFDDAVRIADEPDTSEIKDLEEQDEAYRIEKSA